MKITGSGNDHAILMGSSAFKGAKIKTELLHYSWFISQIKLSSNIVQQRRRFDEYRVKATPSLKH